LNKILSRIFVWGFVVITLLPIYWIVSTSFKQVELATRFPPVFLFVPSLNIYMEVFIKYHFMNYLMNSLIISITVLLVSLAVGTLAAYSLARYKTGGKPLTLAIMVVQMIPPMVITFPLFIFIQKMGLIDTKTGLILAQFTFSLPFIIWVMRQFFMQIPIEIEEAARIDGANVIQIFYRIILPMSIPGLASASIFTFLQSWNEFIYALTLTLSKAETTTLAASKFVTAYSVLWAHVDAIATLIMFVPIILTLLMRRNIVSGLIGDSMKG
jgi:multiple sugar transport system permease protein